MFEKSTPKPKREFVITKIIQHDNRIYFGASKNVLQEIKKNNFGTIIAMTCGYVLVINPLLGFNEVVEYLQSFKE